MSELGDIDRKRVSRLTDSDVENMYCAANDNYVQYVMEKVVQSENERTIIHHDVTDWRDEMRQHIDQKYPLSPDLVNTSLYIAEAKARKEALHHGQA